MSVFNALACASCHMEFGLTAAFMDARREDHNGFKCPNGHENYFPQKTDAELAREELARVKQRLVNEQKNVESAQNCSRHYERRLRATRGVVTRLKNRAKA